MYIETIVPYEPEKKLGYAIKRAFKKVENWALVLDHDVFVSLNPLWYEICMNAISKMWYQAGWIACSTNQIGCPLQKADYNFEIENYNYSKKYDTNDMTNHFEIAEKIYKERKGQIKDITEQAKKHPLSGFFMLTHKQTFDEVMSKFDLSDNKFIGFDTWYCARLIDLGYKIYIMRDLYVYHGYKRLWKNKEWGK